MSSTLAAFGLDGIKYLDEISDRNLVWCFRYELGRINRGQHADLTVGTRRRLIVNGILVRHGMSSWELTVKGKRILEGLRENR
jgi:hypothetical protein